MEKKIFPFDDEKILYYENQFENIRKNGKIFKKQEELIMEYVKHQILYIHFVSIVIDCSVILKNFLKYLIYENRIRWDLC